MHIARALLEVFSAGFCQAQETFTHNIEAFKQSQAGVSGYLPALLQTTSECAHGSGMEPVVLWGCSGVIPNSWSFLPVRPGCCDGSSQLFLAFFIKPGFSFHLFHKQDLLCLPLFLSPSFLLSHLSVLLLLQRILCLFSTARSNAASPSNWLISPPLFPGKFAVWVTSKENSFAKKKVPD